MQSVDPRLEQSLQFNRDVLTRIQAREYGFSDRQIDLRLKSGEWQRMAPSVFLTSAVVPTFEHQCVAGVLWAHGYVSHESAAYLHRLDGFDEEPVGPVQITTRKFFKRGPRDGFRVIRSGDINPRDITSRENILVLGEERTLIDLAPTAKPFSLMLAFEHLVRMGRWQSLLDRLQELGNGRRGLEFLEHLLHRRGPNPTATESAAEAICDHFLLREGFVAQRQLPVTYRGRSARIDLAFPKFGIAVECDSKKWHDNDPRFFGDRERDGWLSEYGWQVVRFTWRHLQDERAVVKRVRNNFERRKGLPPPPLYA